MRNSARSCAVTLMLLLAGSATADVQPTQWEFSREISVPSDDGGYARLELDRDTYARARPDLADLRVVRGGAQEVPYALQEERGGKTEALVDVAVLNKSVVPKQYSLIVLDTGPARTATNHVVLETPNTNFMRRVEVEGSDDVRHWAVLNGKETIFDFTREGYRTGKLAVSYPESIYRYIRVKVWNYDEKPVQLSGARASRLAVEPAREVVLYSGTGEIVENSEMHSTDIVVDLGSPMPTELVQITSPDANYNREVRIAESKDRRTWQDIGCGVIMRYDTPRFMGRQPRVEYLRSSMRYVRVRILNHDNRPIRIGNVKVLTIGSSLTFPYENGASYKLYYGNAYARAPIYDIAATLENLPSLRVRPADLGPVVRNSEFRRPIATAPWLDQRPWVIWVVLVGAVVLLALLMLRLVLQTKAAPPGEGQV